MVIPQNIYSMSKFLEPMNVTLLGKMAIAGVIKFRVLEMKRSSWIIQVSPKSSGKCPYKTEGENGVKMGGKVQRHGRKPSNPRNYGG